jgi:prepilin-type N-terminal cleavage/methylation domain-containing protein
MRAMVRGSSYSWAHAAAGFTLVESLVVLVVAAILLTIGVPALQSFINKTRLDTVADGFASALSEARSEAAKLGINVSLTSTSTGLDWSAGWTMKVVAGAPPAGMPSTLRNGAALSPGFTLKSTVAAVTFDPTGHQVGAGAASEFVVCRGSGGVGASKMILVAPAGGVRVAQTDSATGYPIDATGAPYSGCL